MNELSFKRGDTWRFVFAYRDDQGAPINLTGCTARLHLRTRRDAELLLALDTQSGSIVIDELAGDVAVTASAGQTQPILIGTHVTDLELTYPDGTVKSSGTIIVQVLEDVTHG